MGKPPLKRLYFDSNILRSWPNLPNNVAQIFGLANWVKTELYFPETVEDELEAQFVRGAKQEWETIRSAFKRLDKLCHHIIDIDIKASEPSDEELRAAFQAQSNRLKTFWNIQTVPIKEMDLATLLEMSINRDAPFEEIQITDSKHVVTGLQDMAILLSIAAHMQSADKTDRSAFVTNDGIFHKKDSRELLEAAGVTLELFRNVDTLFKDLWEHVWAHTRAGWDAEMAQVEKSLNEQKEEIGKQILSAIDISKLGTSQWRTLVEILKFDVDEFKFVRTEFPPSSCTPPYTETYKRPDGSEIEISAKAYVTVEALAEQWGLTGLFTSFGSSAPAPEPSKSIDKGTLHESVNVSLTGTVQNGIVGNFKVKSIEVSR